MADDLFGEVEERLAADHERFAQTLADIVDLLWMQYDDAADPLETEEWRLLRDLVDQYAAELDMPLIEYVMTRVVDHRALEG